MVRHLLALVLASLVPAAALAGALAALMFRKAVGTRLGHLVEYRGARFELQRMGLSP